MVPEDGEKNFEMADDDNTYIEDQGDVDERAEEMARLAHELAMSKRSAPVKRDLPRPLDMNHSVLRPIHAGCLHKWQFSIILSKLLSQILL